MRSHAARSAGVRMLRPKVLVEARGPTLSVLGHQLLDDVARRNGYRCASSGSIRITSSGVHAALFEIQLALEVAQHLLAHVTLGSQAQQRLAFGVDDRSPDLAVLDQLTVLLVASRWRSTWSERCRYVSRS